MTQTNPYSRKLTVIERMHLRQPNANVVMVVQFSGNLQPEIFVESIKKISEIHPLLKSRVLLTDKQEEAFFVTDDVEEIDVTFIDRTAENQWKDIVRKEVKRPFLCERGPLIRFTVLISKDITELIICCHHLICDGLALIYLIRDLFDILSNKKSDLKMQSPPLITNDVLPLKLRNGFLTRLVYRLINKKWMRKNIRITEDDFRKLHSSFWEIHDNDILTWTLDKNTTQKIIQKSRANNISVNSFLVTALLAAQTKIQGSETFLQKFVISVNIRDRLLIDSKETFGKYATAIRPSLDYDFNQDFWLSAKEIHQQIQSTLTNDNIFASLRLSNFHPVLIDAFSFNKYDLIQDEMLSKIIRKANLDTISVGSIITNLGKITIPTSYNDLTINSIYGPFIFSDTMEKYYGVLTINEQLHFSISFGDPYIDSGTIESIKAKFMAIITKALEE